jgi:hypothetical protein
MAVAIPNLLAQFTHPLYTSMVGEWMQWRDAYNGGWFFRDRYLEKFSTREDDGDFNLRRRLTPIKTHAKSCINEIRDSIFQRLADVVRTGGSAAYANAVAGNDMGVDMRGSTMNAFIGMKVLQELLVMGRCGVYVDMPYLDSVASLADAVGKRPYLYSYAVEDIVGWTLAKPDHPSEFKAILLRDTDVSYDSTGMFPCGETYRYRKVWIDEESDKVNMQFYDGAGNPSDRDGNPTDDTPTVLNLNRIPFVMPDIYDSLLRDVVGHQIALLNIGSTDVNYAIRSNFPIYTEQKPGTPEHIKRGMGGDNTATAGGQGASDKEIKVGVTQGRYYAPNMERPGFIAPPASPLEASMALQEKLEGEIRTLVHLAVQTMATRASAESKTLDNQGLEAGLSFIGLRLENAERRIADYWAAYEDATPSRRATATVMYPKRYNLKSDLDRITESTKLADLATKITSNTARKEIHKQVATTLLGGKVSAHTLNAIYSEIDSAPYVIADPDVVIAAQQASLVGSEVASMSLGYDKGQADIAEKERVARAAAIIAEQSKAADKKPASDPGARGVPELSVDPNASKKEKTNPDGTPKRVRGKGKKIGGQ